MEDFVEEITDIIEGDVLGISKETEVIGYIQEGIYYEAHAIMKAESHYPHAVWKPEASESWWYSSVQT